MLGDITAQNRPELSRPAGCGAARWHCPLALSPPAPPATSLSVALAALVALGGSVEGSRSGDISTTGLFP